jgi:soluble lytic murein transglycosylase-like protein
VKWAVGYVAALWVAALVFASAAKATPAHAPKPVERALAHASHVHHVSRTLLRRLSWCESRFNPYARNPVSVGGEHATGLFQFLPSTWRSTPYGRRYIYSTHYQALAAAWMISHGRLSEWACA